MMAKQWFGAAPDNFSKGRRGHRPEAIVVHIMEGTLSGTDLWFNNPTSKVSAHYGVGKDGRVHEYVSEPDTAFHAGVIDKPSWELIKENVNPNYYTIGIEHEGFGNDDWPDSQYSASAALIADIARRWNIAVDRAHIIGHREIRASKTCPGSRVNLNDLIACAHAVQIAPSTPKSLQVKAIRDTKLREASPSTTAKSVRVILKGSTLDVIEFIDAGERLAGNPYWYLDAQGNFVWAGDTDQPNPTA